MGYDRPAEPSASVDPNFSLIVQTARDAGASAAEAQMQAEQNYKLQKKVDDLEYNLRQEREKFTYLNRRYEALQDEYRRLEARVRRLTPKKVKAKAKKGTK